jgi:hypothetical protein
MFEGVLAHLLMVEQPKVCLPWWGPSWASVRWFWHRCRINRSDQSLRQNVIHSSIFLNSSLPMNIFKLYLSVPKLTNIKLCLLVWAEHRWIYGPSDLTLTGSIYLLVAPCHRWIYMTYIRRWHGQADEYWGTRAHRYGPPIFISNWQI